MSLPPLVPNFKDPANRVPVSRLRTEAFRVPFALTPLGEKTTLLSPETVVAFGIPCCRLVQDLGFNSGEAANFGTPKWLSVANEAAVRRAAMNFLPMLSHQQFLLPTNNVVYSK
ncbi:hypothetical protein Tco_0215140, partial [Tanacetum coccineum]